MRMRSSLLALALSGLIGSAGLAQGPPPGLGNTPDPLKARPAAPAAKADEPARAESPTRARPRKKSSTASRAARQRMAQQQAAIAAAAASSRNNGGMMGPAGAVDPLGLNAPAQPGVVVGGGGPFGTSAYGLSPYANSYYGNPYYGYNPLYGGAYLLSGGVPAGTINLPRTTPATPNTPNAPAAVGGLTGKPDRNLIHGYDGDGVDELRPSVGNITTPRIEKVHGGSHMAGVGVPVRKGEKVYGGNLIPGYGVIGPSGEQVAGGTYTPGFGVQNGGSAAGFGGGLPNYYGASSVPANYGAVTPSYYSGSSLPNQFGAAVMPHGPGNPAGLSYYNTTGTATPSGGATPSAGVGQRK